MSGKHQDNVKEKTFVNKKNNFVTFLSELLEVSDNSKQVCVMMTKENADLHHNSKKIISIVFLLT